MININVKDVVKSIAQSMYPNRLNINCSQLMEISTIALIYTIASLLNDGVLKEIKGQGIYYNKRKGETFT